MHDTQREAAIQSRLRAACPESYKRQERDDFATTTQAPFAAQASSEDPRPHNGFRLWQAHRLRKCYDYVVWRVGHFNSLFVF